MLACAEDDVDSILGDEALHSQPDLVDFMIKVVARKKAEGPSRAFAIGSEFESLLPQEMFYGISEESARRALAMEDRNKRIVTTLRGALNRSDHHTKEASLVARGRAQEKPHEDRLTVVVRYLVTSKFFLAAVPAIGALPKMVCFVFSAVEMKFSSKKFTCTPNQPLPPYHPYHKPMPSPNQPPPSMYMYLPSLIHLIVLIMRY